MDWHTVHSDPRKPIDVTSPEQLRVLWRVERRKQFWAQIITAAIYRHQLGQELRMFPGDESDNNLLHSELARFGFTPLAEKATALVLIENGGISRALTAARNVDIR